MNAPGAVTSPTSPLHFHCISPILPLSLTGNGSWSDRGCVQAAAPTRRTDGFVHCRCNHLTDFGGVELPTTPEELLSEFTDIQFNTFTLDQLVGSATTPQPMSPLSPSPTTAPISAP